MLTRFFACELRYWAPARARAADRRRSRGHRNTILFQQYIARRQVEAVLMSLYALAITFADASKHAAHFSHQARLS